MGDKEILVSIVMNCYNSDKYLVEAIDSIYSQTYTNWEIIFFDNASTDKSAEIAKSYDNKLKYIKNNTLVPLYTARNLAIEYCNGEFIAFLDADDLWLPDKLIKQVTLINSGAKFVYTGYKTLNVSTDEEINYNNSYKNKITQSILYNNYISISSVIISKDVLKKFKFDRNYNLLGDIDLWYRVATEIPLFTTNEVQVINRIHEKNLSKTLKNDWLRERRLFYKKIINCNKIIDLSILYYIIKTEFKGLVKKI